MPKNKNNLSSLNPSPQFKGNDDIIFPAKVEFCLVDDKNKDYFTELGEWDGIGSIYFSPIEDTSNSYKKIAKPLFSNDRIYPLKNELVYIIILPTRELQNNVDTYNYYYFNPINIWNSNHHNSINPDLGDNFQEKSNIKLLQPYDGDIIKEGRFGQSLRFSSTNKNTKIFNPWSETGENGDPITILRNSQYLDNKDFQPQVEDINKDEASIYLTSTQKIPIEVPSKFYKSYNKPPIPPNQYTKPQIIYSADRILFTSKKDSILFSSNKSINLNSKESINIDSPETIIASDKILLGDKKANESIILGDTFLKDLSALLLNLIELGVTLQTPIGTPVPFTPNISIPISAVKLTQTAQNMLNKITKYKSNVVKSI